MNLWKIIMFSKDDPDNSDDNEPPDRDDYGEESSP